MSICSNSLSDISGPGLLQLVEGGCVSCRSSSIKPAALQIWVSDGPQCHLFFSCSFLVTEYELILTGSDQPHDYSSPGIGLHPVTCETQPCESLIWPRALPADGPLPHVIVIVELMLGVIFRWALSPDRFGREWGNIRMKPVGESPQR